MHFVELFALKMSLGVFFLHLRSKEIGIQQPDLLHARLTTAPSPRLLHKNKRNVKIYRMLHVHVTHCYIFF